MIICTIRQTIRPPFFSPETIFNRPRHFFAKIKKSHQGLRESPFRLCHDSTGTTAPLSQMPPQATTDDCIATFSMCACVIYNVQSRLNAKLKRERKKIKNGRKFSIHYAPTFQCRSLCRRRVGLSNTTHTMQFQWQFKIMEKRRDKKANCIRTVWYNRDKVVHLKLWIGWI